MPEHTSFHLRLPATSANLGPGFDALGLAMALYLTIDAAPGPAFAISATGRDASLCASLENNLILTTYRDILAGVGIAAPPLHLVLHNEIPLGMGCGSSAAALLAGVFLADHFGHLRWSGQQILDEACRREGHPDNVAACFHGGMTASMTIASAMRFGAPVPTTGTTTIAATCGRDLDWRLVLAIPRQSLATSEARALLPETYTGRQAVGNIQSTALLVSAFALNRPDLLRTAMQDHLHQPFRASACPLLPLLLPLVEHSAVYGVALSGAGPSVLLITDPSAPIEPLLSDIRHASGQHLQEVLETRITEGASTA